MADEEWEDLSTVSTGTDPRVSGVAGYAVAGIAKAGKLILPPQEYDWVDVDTGA